MGGKTQDTLWIIAIDLVIVNIIFALTLFIRFGNLFYNTIWQYVFFATFVSLVYLISLFVFYKFEYASWLDTIIETGKVCFIALILIAAVAYFDWTFRLPRTVIGILFWLSFLYLSLSHIMLIKRVKEHMNTVIVGEDVGVFRNYIKSKKYNLIGFFSGSISKPKAGLPFLGRIDELKLDIKRHKIGRVLLALPKKEIDTVLKVLLLCHDLPVKVKALPGKYDFVLVNPSSVDMKGNLVDITLSTQSLFEKLIKRIFDIGFALFGFVVTSLFWVLVPFLIVLDSKGSIIYKQTRTSLFNKTFTLYKFRTMKVGAERSGPVITDNKRDSRITKVGGFLRRFHLDEIPQLWNILMGDMSVVGPRPERPVFNKKFNKKIKSWSQRAFIKPGLTGYAQVYDITGLQPEEKLKYDLYYMKNQNFFLDLKIVIRQILKLFVK